MQMSCNKVINVEVSIGAASRVDFYVWVFGAHQTFKNRRREETLFLLACHRLLPFTQQEKHEEHGGVAFRLPSAGVRRSVSVRFYFFE